LRNCSLAAQLAAHVGMLVDKPHSSDDHVIEPS